MSLAHLARDTRGAVLVMGAIFAALLVGILWHMVGVGDAIVYRERMQEAADATAFESAVWHARTMNLLAALNIIMSAILSFLVLYRTVELLLGVAIIVCTLLSAIPVVGAAFGFLAQAAERGLTKMAESDGKIYSGTEKWLIRVNKAQKIVSTAAPAINLIEPGVANTGYFSGPHINGVVPVSFSILPSVESFAQRGHFPPRMNMGPWLPAMPVQEEGYWKLCTKAGEFVPRQIGEFQKRLKLGDGGVAIEKIGGALGKITGSFPGYFCGSIAAPNGVDDAIKDASKKDCDAEEAQYNKDNAPDGGTPSTKFDRDKCEQKAERKAKFQKDQISVKPSKVWDVARNGGLFFQTWSFAEGDPNWTYGDDAGVAIANGGAGQGNGDDWTYHVQAAEAEYYYNTEANDPWDVCSGDALWNLKWSARLRRVHDPVDMFDAAGFATGYGVNAINKMVTEIVNKIPKIKIKSKSRNKTWELPSFVAKGLKGNLFDTWFSNENFKKRLRNVFQDKTYGNDWDRVGMWVTGHYEGNDRPKMIH